MCAERASAAALIAALVVLIVHIVSGCASPRPAPIYGWNWTGPAPEGFYLVRSGDSLSLVSERLGVSMRKLAKWNRLRPPYRIYADTLLRVTPPDGKPPRRVAAAPRRSGPTQKGPAERRDASPPKPSASRQTRVPAKSSADREAAGSRAGPSSVTWRWPLDGELAKRFRAGDRTRQGIRIKGRAGEQVRAAAAGVVVYSGSGLKGYGNLTIVKHNNKYLSAYGFNRRLLAAEGDSVRGGQAIAEIGKGPDGDHILHFEVRRDGVAVDPILYLPARR
ncbi:peptidoglycan DD-metalloendopeptidase family protein [Thiorhodococcus minor]|uniref:Peptidoglycan DD-metalloendopeptidase family protein n=1 Tax=Thiorhodococcus minor TaxID=57489 RepID=A0A6M0JX77_9GAMM|nr:peptidoglycan DD-metalloendopeptidase family protein [Thiorhodococcus minor]NEV61769.1 peptidoglycan DD-metalloendopeptidase family protein [Thiorhodococcus minor]